MKATLLTYLALRQGQQQRDAALRWSRAAALHPLAGLSEPRANPQKRAEPTKALFAEGLARVDPLQCDLRCLGVRPKVGRL